MGAISDQRGFTITELVVSLVVLSIFLMLFFQLFMSGESQRLAVIRHASASDIAMTNLQKISARALIPTGTTECDETTVGSANPNNLVLDPGEETEDPTPGSPIATNATNGETTPTWITANLSPESLTGTNLPASTVQRLGVVYPRGCDFANPVKIISTVTYGSETVSRAAFIN